MIVTTVHSTESLDIFPTVVIREKATAYDVAHATSSEDINKLVNVLKKISYK